MTRDELNNLRGLACLMLVANHVVGGTPQEGLQLASGGARVGVDALAAVRMPLFATIAGYAHFHVRQTGWALWQDKAYRLLWPMLLTGTLFALLQAEFGRRNQAPVDWTTLHLLPVAHYWFLESLFWVILLWSLMHSLRAKAAFTLLAVLAYCLGLGTPWLGLAGAVYLAPFFALGWWWAHAKPPAHEPRLRRLAWLGLACVGALILAVDNPALQRMTPAMLMAGALACAALFTLRPTAPGLRWLGELSYVVFLFHVFFTAPMRQFLNALGLSDPWVHLLLGVAGAVACSALVRSALQRMGGPALWFMGARKPGATASLPPSGAKRHDATHLNTSRLS